MPNGGCVTTSPELVKAALRCRACGSPDMVPYLDLGEQALANAFRQPTDTSEEFTAPLAVQWCPTCGLSQLTHVVAPEKLYSHYLYTSGGNAGWLAHERQLVEETRKPGKQFVVEIASNDGTLLTMFQGAGHKVLGIEPAANLADTAAVPTMRTFWGPQVAEGVVQFHGHADLMIAQNVFGHVDDAYGFLVGVKTALAPDGVCIVECPYIMDLLRNGAFDTIYHEHLSYWGLTPLLYAAAHADLEVVGLRHFPGVHGGSMRYYLKHPGSAVSAAVQECREREAQVFLGGIHPYQTFAKRVQHQLRALQDMVDDAQSFKKSVWGIGAAAKGNVLLQAAQITLDAIVDDNPLKQGLVSPGQRIPILPLADNLDAVDILVVLPWNWALSLVDRAASHGFRGKLLIPFPDPHYA